MFSPFYIIFILFYFFNFAKFQNNLPFSLSQIEDHERLDNNKHFTTTKRPKIIIFKTTRKTKLTTNNKGDRHKFDENNIGRKIGPIILPKDSIEILPEHGEKKHEIYDNKVTPAPNRAGNCQSLAKYCNHRAYRRILQRHCQTTCGRDDCLDQRGDLCLHWENRGFCKHPFYKKMRWKCSRTCGLCRIN